MAKKKLSNPNSTGGAGVHFENRIQASFLALMLAGGFAPGLPCWPIAKIKLQGKHKGYETDDLIVFVERSGDKKQCKMLAQIKRTISITQSDPDFGEVIMAAWSDFNNPNVFNKNNDVIALITGPISAADINDVRELLEWARGSETEQDFFQKIELPKYSSTGKQEKLKAFRYKLTEAKENEVSPEELFQFLRHFHLLGYDLDVKAGVALSLLHSLIRQYSNDNVQNFWTRLVDEVASANECSGTFTPEILPEDLKGIFEQRETKKFPAELGESELSELKSVWVPTSHQKELAIANLLGSWNENVEFDRAVVSQLANGEDYYTWIEKLREILQQEGNPIVYKNGIWHITKRQELLQSLGAWLYDNTLTTYKKCVVDVLKERDPQFELSKEERYAASMHGKVLKHSQDLRTGLADGLALLGNDSSSLVHCTNHKAEEAVVLSVREILRDADFVLWGGLNNLLPIIAEAAPNTFLEAIEVGLRSAPCPFSELFLQEENGVFGRNYLSGLWWALETLAWDEQYLVRVTVILGALAEIDPGGKWANRPANSLTTIFLPWYPQTVASPEKRKVAIQTLINEHPQIAWKLLINLLPNQIRTSSGSHKPTWRMLLPIDWKEGVSQQEYREQVGIYVDLAVEMAIQDFQKMKDLVTHIDHLTLAALKAILEYLASDEVSKKSEEDRLPIWNELMAATVRYKREGSKTGNRRTKTNDRIEDVAQKIAPCSPVNRSRRLFENRTIPLPDVPAG